MRTISERLNKTGSSQSSLQFEILSADHHDFTPCFTDMCVLAEQMALISSAARYWAERLYSSFSDWGSFVAAGRAQVAAISATSAALYAVQLRRRA